MEEGFGRMIAAAMPGFLPVRDPSEGYVHGFIVINEVSTVVPNLSTVVINKILQGCITITTTITTHTHVYNMYTHIHTYVHMYLKN